MKLIFLSYLILSYLILSYLILSYLILSYLILSYLILIVICLWCFVSLNSSQWPNLWATPWSFQATHYFSLFPLSPLLSLSLPVAHSSPMRLCHPPDGSTSPKYKLLCFITTKKICKEKNALAFNWDRCCHLVLCLQLILTNWFPCHFRYKRCEIWTTGIIE